MYIILEAFDEDYITPVMDEESGITMKFDEVEDATKYADENIQKPIIVYLPVYHKGVQINVKERVINKINGLLDSADCALSKEEIEMADGIITEINKYLF